MSTCEVSNLLDIVEVRADEADGRTVEGRVVPYDKPTALYGDRVFEVFKRGSLARTVKNRGAQPVPLYLTHGARSLVGHATAFEDRDDGMHATFRISETQQGEEALTLLRDGTVRSFSIGFIPIPGKTKIIDEEDRRVTYERSEVKLDHVALVPNPAYREARVLALRSVDEIEEFDPDELREMLRQWRSGELALPQPEPRTGLTIVDARARLEALTATA